MSILFLAMKSHSNWCLLWGLFLVKPLQFKVATRMAYPGRVRGLRRFGPLLDDKDRGVFMLVCLC